MSMHICLSLDLSIGIKSGDLGSVEQDGQGMVNTRMELRIDGLERMIQDLVQDQGKNENEQHERFQRLEDMIKGLTVVVEKLSVKDKTCDDNSVVNEGKTGDDEDVIGHSGFSSTWRKLDIPVFAGEEAYGWINRLERYFKLKEVSDEEKMRAVIIALEGKTLNLFQWWETCNPNPKWDAFKVAVVCRFQPNMLKNPFEILIGLRQTSGVEDYIEKFEQYAGFLKGINQDYLVGIFLNGLKEEVKAEVKLYEPANLAELMMKAQMVEEKIRVTAKTIPPVVNKTNNTYKPFSVTRSYSKEGGNSVVLDGSNKGRGEGSEVASTGCSTSGMQRPRGAPFRKLTQEELQDKIKKGLCFSCDEKFGPNHMCRNKQLHMLLMSEEELSGLDALPDKNSNQAQELEDGSQTLQLSMCTMAGLTTKKSWKLGGSIGKEDVVVLLDCGTSHNFISHELISKCGLQQEQTRPYVV